MKTIKITSVLLIVAFFVLFVSISPGSGHFVQVGPEKVYGYSSSESSAGSSFNFSYIGSPETWVAPYDATYTIECWGAGFNSGGTGGYSKGNIFLTAGTTLIINVGGQPLPEGVGGYNGGGYGFYYHNKSPFEYRLYGTGGCGATDVRLAAGTLTDRIIVAGGASRNANGGGFTGSSGLSGYNALLNVTYGGGTGGSQTSGGAGGASSVGLAATSGTLGQGGRGGGCEDNQSPVPSPGSGGGGGYYGGGGGGVEASGGGGSSYISGHPGCVSHSSGYVFTSTELSSGVNKNVGKVVIFLPNSTPTLQVNSPTPNGTLFPSQSIVERGA